MSDILFKKPDGSFVTVPAESAQEAINKGYEPATPEQVTASQQTGQAALEGVARGATLGFGDQLIADVENAFSPQTGGVAGLEQQRRQTLEEMRLRRQENKGAALAGEVGGALAMSVATGGGPSALVGGGFRGALLEGGLSGLGAVVSETTLDKSPLTMDKMAAGMAGGAIVGGGIAGAMKGAGALVSAGMKKLGGSTISQTLRDAADKAYEKMLTGGNLSWARKNKAFMPDILEVGRKTGVLHAGAALDEATALRAEEVARGYASDIAEAAAELEGYVPLKGNDALRKRFAASLTKSIDSEFEGRPTFESAAAEAKKIIASIEKNKELTWSDAWRIQSDLFKDLAGKEAPPASAEVRESLRQAMRDFVFDEVASGKDMAAKVLTAPTGFDPKLKSKLDGAPATPWRRSASVPITDDGGRPISGGVFNAPETVGGPNLPDIAQAADSEFYLPQQQASRPLTVRLGEPVPESIFIDPSGKKISGAFAGADIPESQMKLPNMENMTAAEIEDLARNWQGRAPKTVALESGTMSEGLLLDVPPMQTPAWFGAHMRQLGREARAAMALSKAISNRATALESAVGSNNAAIGGIASLATGNPLPLAGALVGDALRDQVKKRGGFVLGGVLRNLSESNALESIANGLQGRVGQVLSVAPAMLGAARIPIEAAFGRGALALLEEHVRIASGPDGGAYLAALGLTNETPEEVEAVGGRLAAMDALHAAQRDVDRRIDLGIDAVLGTKSGPISRYKSPDSSDFKTRIEKMKQAAADPEAAFANVPADLLAGAPSTTAELVNKLLMANQFLLSKAPKDPYAGMPPALKPRWEPSAADLSKWYRYVEAVEQPSRMLEKMAQGTFTLEHKEALQAVYPALYEDMKVRMYERLSQWEKPLPYGKKAMLSQFFGTSVLGLKPGSLALIQQSFKPKEGDSPSQGGTRPDGRQSIDSDKNALTQAQRIEAKGAVTP